MASIINRPNGNRWIQFTLNQKRQTVRLGRVNLKYAEDVRRRVEHIVSARRGNHSLDPETAEWLTGIDDVLHGRFAAADLATPRQAALLGPFIDDYIASRTTPKTSPRTIENLTNAAARLTTYFGYDCDFRSITTTEADAWAAELRDTYKPSTAGRTIKRARQFAKIAIHRKLIDENPFIHLSIAGKIDATRKAFIDRATAAAVLAACPSVRWRLIFALARYAAFRVPSELAVLKWPDIQWDAGTLIIDAPKTGVRTVPIAPELRPYLEDAWDAAAEGDIKVFPDITENSNLGTTLQKYIKRAGFNPWPKTFHNLRASCETEWMRSYPLHVACSWTGNSPVVALTHYARIIAEDQEGLARRDVISGPGESQNPKHRVIKTEAPRRHARTRHAHFFRRNIKATSH